MFVCSLAVIDPRVGHTIDVLSPFILVLCHSDGLFHGESCPRLDVVHPVAFLAFVHLALFLALSLSPGNSLVSSWRDHSMLAFLRHLSVPQWPGMQTLIRRTQTEANPISIPPLLFAISTLLHFLYPLLVTELEQVLNFLRDDPTSPGFEMF